MKSWTAVFLLLLLGSLRAHEAPSPVLQTLSPFWANPGLSGAWYDPNRSGEGWLLEMQEDGSAVAVWFTHAPAGAAAGQRWIVAQDGVVTAGRIVFERSFTTTGGRFGANFDPAQVQSEPWGRLQFDFADCGHGTVSYAGPAAYGSGQRDIVRLLGLHELDCGGARNLTAAGARAASALHALSGTWYDPTHSGEGVIVEALSADRIAATWFTYTPDGAQAWLIGVGTLSNGRLSINEVTRSQGTRFGDAFNPAAITAEPWGSLVIEFSNCANATLSYTATASGFGSGTQRLQRLTTPAGAVCLDSLRPAQTGGQWTQGAPMPSSASEVATAVVDGRAYVAGNFPAGRELQRFDPGLAGPGGWLTLPVLPGGRDHMLALGYRGGVWMFGGNRGLPDADSTGWRYDVVSQNFESLPADLPESGASGAAELNGYFYLGDTTGALIQFDPRQRTHRRILPAGPVGRDHSNVVAFLGEIWMIGGRGALGSANSAVSIYNPVSETWRTGPAMRDTRSGFAAAVVGQQIMVAGGERLRPTTVVVPTLEMISAGEDAWSRGPDLPTPVHGVGAASLNGRFYAVGGSILAGVAQNPGVVQIYTPTP